MSNMVLGMRKLAALSLAASPAVLLGACAGQQSLLTYTSPVTLESDAEQAADALMRAELAASRGNKDALTSAVRTIDRIGARPLENDVYDPLPGWRAGVDEGPPMRGRALGPGYVRGELAPGAQATMEQTFLSGRKARIALAAPDEASVALQVADKSSEERCNRKARPLVCNWVPILTERYRITVTNNSRRRVAYYLVVE